MTTPPLISLCVIAGPEQAVITRFLDAFGAAFDELSLVSALGAATPDDTFALAKAWCEQHGKAFLHSFYRNSPEAAAWPHVDSFAEARNQAFRQATGQWLVWADCDDIVSPDTPIAKLREIVAEAKADALHFPYEVPGTNKKILRERALRRTLLEKGRRWIFGVHENFRLDPADLSAAHEAPVWLHSPAAKKPMSIDRNLRILDHSLRDVPTQLFYAHQEHFLAGRKPAARHYGDQALAFRELPQSFRYEILLNFAKMAKNAAEGLEFSGRAFGLLPNCREALALMTMQAFSLGDADRALVTSEALVALPEPPPEKRAWTHEAKWYGWAGWDLRARALRHAKKHHTEIAAAQACVHEGRAPIISLLHATRGRPQQAFNTRELWFNTAVRPQCIEHIYAVDCDDKDTLEMVRQFEHIVAEPAGSCVRAWNAAARIARGTIFLQLSDDWVPTYAWDEKLLQAIAGARKDPASDPVVVAVSDGTRRDQLLCMAILNRRRWEDQACLMFSTEYESMYSDNEFSWRAYRDRVVIEARDIEFQHLHPAFGKAQMDATYAAQNAPERYVRGWESFVRRNPDAPRPQMPQGASLARALGTGNPYVRNEKAHL